MSKFEAIIDDYDKTVEEFVERKKKAVASDDYRMVVDLGSCATAKKLEEFAVLLEEAAKNGELSDEQKKRIKTITAKHNRK